MKRLAFFLFCIKATTWAVPTYNDDNDLLPGALLPSKSKAIPFKYTIKPRIIDGLPPGVGQFPWQAALYLNLTTGSSFCGGALIRPTWLLTAAHCTEGVVSIFVRLGVVRLNMNSDATATNTTAARVIPHPDYSPITLENDIALVELSDSIEAGLFVDYLPIEQSPLGVGVNVTISGFGKMTDTPTSRCDTLQYIFLNTISNSDCEQIYGNQVTSTIGCAKGATTQNICDGDSGGALVSGYPENSAHVGVVSFGSSEGCDKGYPVGFTRTSAYWSWIISYIGN